MNDRTEVEALRAQVLELQTQVSFQEDAIAKLNEAFSRQQQDLAGIQRHWELMSEQFRELRGRLADDGAAGAADPANEPPPPHY